MNYQVIKKLLQLALIALLTTGAAYYLTKIFTEWDTLDNEGKFSTVLFLGLFCWLVIENMQKLRTGNSKSNDY